MKKKVIVLLNDYWHPRHTIEPALPGILPKDLFDVSIIDDPDKLKSVAAEPDLVVNFKDGIDNVPANSPNWYDETIAHLLNLYVKQIGGGYMAVHCGLANIPQSHEAYTSILCGRFLSHPPMCPVEFQITESHPITDGLENFSLNDEHYVMEMMEGETNILGYTKSEHGTHAALWAHACGNGRVCGVTPGHTTEVFQTPGYTKLLQNAAKWCAKLI